MFIAHVYFAVKPEAREAALAKLVEQTPTVHAMEGCQAFIPFIDPIDETRIGVLHEWEDQQAFKGYTNSPPFAELGRVLRPIMIESPKSLRFDAMLIETVN